MKNILFLLFLICFSSVYSQRSFYQINKRCTADYDIAHENVISGCRNVDISITRDYNQKAFFFFQNEEKIKLPYTQSEFMDKIGIVYYWNRSPIILIAFKSNTNIPESIGVIRKNNTILFYYIESWRQE